MGTPPPPPRAAVAPPGPARGPAGVPGRVEGRAPRQPGLLSGDRPCKLIPSDFIFPSLFPEEPLGAGSRGAGARGPGRDAPERGRRSPPEGHGEGEVLLREPLPGAPSLAGMQDWEFSRWSSSRDWASLPAPLVPVAGGTKASDLCPCGSCVIVTVPCPDLTLLNGEAPRVSGTLHRGKSWIRG